MKVPVSDREILSVLWFLRECPAGEELMSIGLRLFEAFELGASKWAVPDDGRIDMATFSDEPADRDLSTDDLMSLRHVLSRPGQAPAMWLTSARALRRLKEAGESGGALASVP